MSERPPGCCQVSPRDKRAKVRISWSAVIKPVVRHGANGYGHKERIEHKEP